MKHWDKRVSHRARSNHERPSGSGLPNFFFFLTDIYKFLHWLIVTCFVALGRWEVGVGVVFTYLFSSDNERLCRD